MVALEMSIVILLVTGSIGFSAWRLSPAKLRLRFLDRIAPWFGGHLVARLRQATLAELAQGCGACARTRIPAALRR